MSHRAARLLFSPAFWPAAAMLCGDDYNGAGIRADVPTSGYSFFNRRMGYIVTPWNTSATKYWLVGDPADCQGLEVGFVNGRDTPDLFLADHPRAGTTLRADAGGVGVQRKAEANYGRDLEGVQRGGGGAGSASLGHTCRAWRRD